MLAKNVNDNAFRLDKCGAGEFFASKLAPTVKRAKKRGLEKGLFFIAGQLVRLAVNHAGGVIQQALGRCLQERLKLLS